MVSIKAAVSWADGHEDSFTETVLVARSTSTI
jgi:hypothetical protein